MASLSILICLFAVVFPWTTGHPLLYRIFQQPYYGYGFASTGFHHNYLNDLLTPTEYYSSFGYQPHYHTSINLFAESPYAIEKHLAVVPLFVIPENNINMISSGQIMNISDVKPMMTVETKEKNVIQCTPAVRIVLEQPFILYSLKSSILFPSEVTVLHQHLRIPIAIGAVIVPVLQDTYVSQDSPLSINVVYAIPTQPLNTDFIDVASDGALNKPLNFGGDVNKKPVVSVKPTGSDYVNNEKDVLVDSEGQAVIVESNTSSGSEVTTVTVDNFPDTASTPLPIEPVVAEDDDELVNRNPPATNLDGFHNSKESFVLNDLREQAKKDRL